MASPGGSNPRLRDLLRTAFRQKWKALGFFCAALAVTVGMMGFYPRKYASEAKLFLRKGRETVSLDPTATTGQTVSLMESREHEINSVVEMMESRGLVETVVDELGPTTIFGDSDAAQGVSTSQRERAVRHVQNGLQVVAEKKSNVITLEYQDRTPRRAQRIAEALLAAYQDAHLRVNRTPGSHEFFDEQAELMKQQWHQAASRLRDLKNEVGLVTIDDQRQLLQQEASRIQGQLGDTRSQLAAVSAKVKELQRMVDELPSRKVIQEEDGHTDAAVDGMRQQLYELQIKERELTSKYTENHPSVIAVRAQLHNAQEILAAQRPQRVRSMTQVNPQREALQLSLLTQQAEESALAARVEELRLASAQVQKRVKQLNGLEVEINRLEREVSLAAENHRAYSDNLEQARISAALERDRISNVTIYQPPTLQIRPVSPRKGVVLALGLVVAVLGSIATVMFCEHLDGSLRTAEEVESELSLPVLVSLPRTRPQTSLATTA